MNNEEKILALLEKQATQLEKQATQLEKLTADMADMKAVQNAQGEQLAAQGEQLAAQQSQLNELAAMQEELRNAVNRVAFKQEHIVIPSLRTIAGSHSDLREELASKESVEELKSDVSLALSGVKTHTAQISVLTDRVTKLEKAN